MKRNVSLLLVVIMMFTMLSAIGCTNEGKVSKESNIENSESVTSNVENNTKDEVIELRFSWWGSEERHEATLKAIDYYEEKHPDIKIIPEYSGFTGYQDKLTAQIAGNNAPDIFSGVSEWFPQQQESNALRDLTGMIDVHGQNPQIVESCSINGELLGVNLAVNGATYTYNKTILEQLNITELDADYTWGDFAEKCKEIAIKSDGKIYGAVDSSVVYEQFAMFGYTYLQKEAPFPYDNDVLTCTAEDVATYYQYWADLREAGAVAPPEISVTSVDNSLVTRGIAVFVPVWSATFPQFQNETSDQLEMIIMPNGPVGERPDSSRPGITLSVFKGSEHPEEAAAFIDFMANDEEVAKILKTSRGVLPTEIQREVVLNEEGLLSDID